MTYLSVILTFGLLICAVAQFYNAHVHSKVEMYKLKLKHLQELKDKWNCLLNNIYYAQSYKAKLGLTDDYKTFYKDFELFLDAHLTFTKFLFKSNTYELEKEFVSALLKLLPAEYTVATSVNLCTTDFDNAVKLYNEFLNESFKEIRFNKFEEIFK